MCTMCARVCVHYGGAGALLVSGTIHPHLLSSMTYNTWGIMGAVVLLGREWPCEGNGEGTHVCGVGVGGSSTFSGSRVVSCPGGSRGLGGVGCGEWRPRLHLVRCMHVSKGLMWWAPRSMTRTRHNSCLSYTPYHVGREGDSRHCLLLGGYFSDCAGAGYL
jgi:hypothetical protein